MQAPPMQEPPEGQALVQNPQLFGSDVTSVHPLPQSW